MANFKKNKKKMMLDLIPEELLSSYSLEEDVSIIIGENGCGKSTLLSYLANHHTIYRKDVIGIANTIHDKFDIRKNNFYSLKWQRGQRQTIETVKSAIKIISKENEQGLRNVTRALEYTGFDPRIGFTAKQFNPKYVQIIEDTDQINDKKKKEIISLLYKLDNENKYDVVTWFEMGNYNFHDINLFSITMLFPYEFLLKKLKIISGFDIYLSKDKQKIPLLKASSGELSLITSIIFLSTIIKDRKTVILIDEPENSLHPKWQREYVRMLLDIFYLYQPKIVIATHSPMIVTGAEMSMRSPRIYKAKNFRFSLQNKDPKNIEEIYYQLFGISTPENRFLSNLLVKSLNQLANKDLDENSFNDRIDMINESIFDMRQFEIIREVKQIAKKIINQ